MPTNAIHHAAGNLNTVGKNAVTFVKPAGNIMNIFAMDGMY